jgi:hypothetical protein
MEIKNIDALMKRTINADVDGADPIRCSCSQSMISPRGITIEYTRVNNSIWKFHSVDVGGPKIKRDGTPGQEYGTKRYWSMTDGEVPDWVREFVDQHQGDGN